MQQGLWYNFVIGLKISADYRIGKEKENMPDCFNYCRPEAVGIHPDWIADYVNEVERRGLMCHSFAMVRHGQLFAEGYWKPFTAERLHRMYSVSKSFLGAAIGLLCDEGRIHLDDRIIDYFPEYLTEAQGSYICDTTIRHMLMMATANGRSRHTLTDFDWLPAFFRNDPVVNHPPGTIFNYDTSATTTLCVLVERLVGKPFLEYLKDKMLRELGFSEEAWCVETPEGYSWAGSGVQCTTRDLARLALVFLNEGCVNGKQYLSREYVKAATSRQIDNCTLGQTSDLDGNGYGYQIWMTREGSFSFLGMGVQMAVCVPKYDLLFVCTSDMQGRLGQYQEVFDSFWYNIVKRLEENGAKDVVLSDDRAYDALQRKLQNLSCVLPQGQLTSPRAAQVNGVTWRLHENPMGIEKLKFTFDEDGGIWTYDTDRGEKKLSFGFGHYVHDIFPEKHYFGKRIGEPKGSGYHCMTAATWTEPNKLVIRCYAIDDYLGHFTASFSFQKDQISVMMHKEAEGFFGEYQGMAGGERL